MKIKASDVIVPLDVPKAMRVEYVQNYLTSTRESGRLLLFAGDQKAEHLNRDFIGGGIHPQDSDPEHLFRIASQARIGVFATQPGLITRYGMDYPDVPYLVKLNAKTDLVTEADPVSQQWLDVKQVVDIRDNSGLKILAVGYSVYLGSVYESIMLHQAAQIIFNAHQQGLLAVLWICLHGKAVKEKDERNPHMIAGAVGVGACLGCDFVRVAYPTMDGAEPREIFKEATLAAGRTKVISSAGSSREIGAFLGNIHDQIHISGAAGISVGRNIYQRSSDEAIKLCNAVHAVIIEGASVEDALAHMLL
ncbi:MAG: aldolase [bacterium]